MNSMLKSVNLKTILYDIVIQMKMNYLCFKGTILNDFREGRTVKVKEGEILIIPKGIDHKLHTNGDCI